MTLWVLTLRKVEFYKVPSYILVKHGYYVYSYWEGDGYGDGCWKAVVQGYPSGNKLHTTIGGQYRKHQLCVAIDWALDRITEILNGTAGGENKSSSKKTG